MIGIFDSGSGGLTVLKRLREVLPSADVVYFGDIQNAPYGEKQQDELSKLTVDSIKLLRERGASKIISACNSAASSLALSLYDALSLESNSIIDMVGPTVASLRAAREPLTLCATPATVRSGIYQNAFRMVGIEIEAVPIAGLADAIEFGTPAGEIEKRIIDALGALAPKSLILACTHYPLALDVFAKVLPQTQFFDPALAVAERAYKLFWPAEVGSGTTTFLLSKDSPHFRALARGVVGNEPTVEIVV